MIRLKQKQTDATCFSSSRLCPPPPFPKAHHQAIQASQSVKPSHFFKWPLLDSPRGAPTRMKWGNWLYCERYTRGSILAKRSLIVLVILFFFQITQSQTGFPWISLQGLGGWSQASMASSLLICIVWYASFSNIRLLCVNSLTINLFLTGIHFHSSGVPWANQSRQVRIAREMAWAGGVMAEGTKGIKETDGICDTSINKVIEGKSDRPLGSYYLHDHDCNPNPNPFSQLLPCDWYCTIAANWFWFKVLWALPDAFSNNTMHDDIKGRAAAGKGWPKSAGGYVDRITVLNFYFFTYEKKKKKSYCKTNLNKNVLYKTMTGYTKVSRLGDGHHSVSIYGGQRRGEYVWQNRANAT